MGLSVHISFQQALLDRVGFVREVSHGYSSGDVIQYHLSLGIDREMEDEEERKRYLHETR